jgi:4-hydroxy-tetrahydrodipicolinate reductase
VTPTTPPGLVIVGARGRMGQRLAALASDYDLVVAAGVDADGPPLDDAIATGAACIVDFSVAEQAPRTLRWAASHAVPVVIGTTGLAADGVDALLQAARHVPIVQAPNFSLGVHVLLELVGHAARLLDASWDVELVEAHHRRKVDAPSGTAVALAERVAAARGAALSDIARHGRHGQVGARPRGELGVHALRGGSVVGEHRVSFFGEGELVTLEHRALDRDIFARGALASAAWLTAAPRAPGRYGLADVLGGS